MTDTTREAQEERARRLRQQIEEMSKGKQEGPPKTPRDFVDPARRVPAGDEKA